MVSGGAKRLIQFIAGLRDFDCEPAVRSGYKHMGGTLTDAILQCGLNYRTVVYPRVANIIRRFPAAHLTTSFWDVLHAYSPADVLSWSHPEKPRRLLELTNLLVRQGVQTEDDLSCWIIKPSNADAMLDIKGIGPKTLDYLKLLVGVQTVAVDRHIRTFVALAGLDLQHYEEIRQVVLDAACILRIDPATLDHRIWRYVSMEQTPQRSLFD